MPRKKPPELTFQQHLADLLVCEHGYIVDKLIKLKEIGFDGQLLSWVDYLGGLERWNREIMSRLEQAGLRHLVRR